MINAFPLAPAVDPFALVPASARIGFSAVAVLFAVLPFALVAFAVGADELAEAVSLIVIKLAGKPPLPRHFLLAAAMALAHVPVAVVGEVILRAGEFALAVAIAALHRAAVEIAAFVLVLFEISRKGIVDRRRFCARLGLLRLSFLLFLIHLPGVRRLHRISAGGAQAGVPRHVVPAFHTGLIGLGSPVRRSAE